jgi:mono/diheme cytochrome c family protein
MIHFAENRQKSESEHDFYGHGKMNATLRALLSGMTFMMAANCAVAQEMGDAKEGFAFASRVCAECHAVRAGEIKSPHTRAPSFQTVANTSAMTSTALRVWFQSPHPSMPNLVLGMEDSDNIVAYILSLKRHP